MNHLNTEIQRYSPTNNFGLSHEQVKKRISDGLVNVDKNTASKSTSDIVKDNLFTLFNFINLILAIAILYTGSYRNLMFMGVVICNSIIGIVQEIKAKKTVDKLNLILSNNATVIREGKKEKIKVDKVVLDDIICFSRGNQIVSDSIITEGKCEVNESFLTGESDLILKKEGDTLLSGSFVVSGSCKAKVEKVGEDNYTSQLLKKSKCIKKTKSEIITTINKIIKIISIAIIPIGGLLFYRQFNASNYNISSAIVTTSAALTGMIPEGLVLLTSSVLAVGVLRLSRRKVLVQDIYCLETLARVDTLCLDKTGTITEGSFEIHDITAENGYTISEVNKAITALTSMLDDNNETFNAVKSKFPPSSAFSSADIVIPFSSEKKWSGVYTKDQGSLVMGAAEFIFGDTYSKIRDKTSFYSKEYRVLTLAHSENPFVDGNLPSDLNLMAFILIKDKIRDNAERTLNFFKKQGVEIKVISGDDPVTVSQIAKRVKLSGYEKYIDMSKVKSTEEVKASAKKYNIFGRVTPYQKQEIIKSLKEDGHTVAMVGDGVNDVLAMKESDCSVAMAGGSDVARSVSHLVLLNSDFASMPRAVAEGRKAINNIQRSSSLFLVKTIYSFLLSCLFFAIPAPYPFIPIQMTLLSAITIGIPSFVLALEPNREKIKGNLFKNILDKSLPAAIAIVFSILLSVSIYALFDISYKRYSTVNVVVTGIIGLILIYKISLPLNKLRKILLRSLCVLFAIGVLKFTSLFELEPLNWINLLIIFFIAIVSVIVYEYVSVINFEKLFNIKNKQKN